VTEEVRVSDKRRIAVECWGASKGVPVFLLHGTPGSRNGPRPRVSVLYRLGIRLISYDRPGYGGSDPHPGRTVADAADDVLAIADYLGLKDPFGVVGRSGGGPHALACAALLGDRVRSAACLVGLAPSNAEDLDWYAGMTPSNVEEYTAMDASTRKIRARLARQVELVRDDPESLIRSLIPELADPDKRVVDDIAIRRLLTDTYAEAVRGSGEGWIDDAVALRRPWQFDLSSIKAPVLLWHGADDMFSPVSHTRWLAERIPNSVLEVQSDVAHFGAFEILPNVLTWIKSAPQLRRAGDRGYASAGAPDVARLRAGDRRQ
jgi:pimeloyl-ACP methyl ester carboxylesterase